MKFCDTMKCPQCGTENVDHASFCGKCGRDLRDETSPEQPAQQQVVYQQAPPKKLTRCSDDQIVGGVCSGLAKYANMDVSLVRLLTVLSFFIGTIPFWAYIIMWIVVPEEPCGPPPK